MPFCSLTWLLGRAGLGGTGTESSGGIPGSDRGHPKIIHELPTDGDKQLLRLWKNIKENRKGRRDQPLSALDELRQLLVRLSQNWARYRVFDWQKEVPKTNNGTEQAIGRMKMRARTVRGYKTWSGMQNGLFLAGTGID